MNLRKKLFMLDKLVFDLKFPKRPYPLGENLHGQELQEYYFVFEEKSIAAGKKQKLIKRFDENGIPINQTYVDVEDKDYVYFPISIGQMGLSVFHTYLDTQSEVDKDRFLKFPQWFRDNVTLDNELGAIWYTDVDLPAYKRTDPWQSAFTQSRAISLLLRGFQLTGEPLYKELAEKALIPFTKAVSEGGVTAFTPWGPIYEEYTADVNTLVLNGHIFALCGLYDFVRVFRDHHLANKLFSEGVESTANILPEFDLGYWSRYNLCSAPFYPEVDPSTIGYQRLHVLQLDFLHRLTGNKTFQRYMNIFDKQVGIWNIIRMYKLKYKALKQIGRL